MAKKMTTRYKNVQLLAELLSTCIIKGVKKTPAKVRLRTLKGEIREGELYKVKLWYDGCNKVAGQVMLTFPDGHTDGKAHAYGLFGLKLGIGSSITSGAT